MAPEESIKKIEMKRVLILVLLYLCTALSSHSQDFEWASSLDHRVVKYLIKGPDGTLLAGATRNPEERESGAMIYSVDGTIAGEEFNFYNADFVINYSSEGKINWMYGVESGSSLAGIALDHNNRIVLLVLDQDGKPAQPEYIMEDEEYEENYEEVENITQPDTVAVNDIQEEEQPEPVIDSGIGYHLIFLDGSGKQTGSKYCKSISERAEVFDFKVNGQSLVLAGSNPTGWVAKNLPIMRTGNSCHFIMTINEEGEPLWADIVASRSNQYDGQGTCAISVAPDGAIYLAGSYYGGAIFDNGRWLTVAPNSYKELAENPGSGFEVYVSNYSNQGKFNWVRTAKNKSDFSALVATADGVYIGYRILEDAKTSFSAPVQLGMYWNSAISFIAKNGNTEWNKAIVGEIKDFDANTKDHLLVTAGGYIFGYQLLNPTIDSKTNYTFTDRDQFYVASFNQKGSLNWVEPSDVYVRTDRQPLHLEYDHKLDRYYVSGYIFCGQPRDLRSIDSAFKEGHCEFGVSFVGWLRRN
jgi:hypothetical protein